MDTRLPVSVNVPSEPAATRRGFCKTAISSAGLLLASGGLSPAFAQGGGEALDLQRDPDLLRACVKMRASLGPEMTMGWLQAKRFAFSEGRVERLHDVHAATFSKLHQVSENQFEFVVIEVSFYTDPGTGTLQKTIRMPFSGEQVEVPVHRFGPTLIRLAVSLDETEHYAPVPGTNQAEFAVAGSVSMTKSIEKNNVINGNLFLQHEEYGRRYPEDSDRPSMFYRESTIWSAPMKEVLDPTRKTVDSEVFYSAMTSWRPWMKMGDIPGNTFSNGYGRRAFAMADLPEVYRSLLEQTNPDVLKDPEAILDGFTA